MIHQPSPHKLSAGCRLALLLLLVSASVRLHADTHYVNIANPVPVAPYTNWAAAATDIQSAIDVSSAGDTVLVTNGVYATGGRVVYGAMTNRVAVAKPIILQSVNGPGVTVIQGYQVPGTTNGDGAIRCVYLADGAVMSGFTLTNGATRSSGDGGREQSGGAVWCQSVSALVTNCTLAGSSAYGTGGGAYSGTLNNCALTGNSAGSGGGAYSGNLNNCLFTGNSAGSGGGAYNGTLNNCTLMGNSAMSGGGAYYGTLSNCTFTYNSAQAGGGAYCGGGPSYDNWGQYSGVAYHGTLNNCVLTGNSAQDGGGAYYGTLNNCTLTGNFAQHGGGAYYGKLSNCILYYNTAFFGPNYTTDFLGPYYDSSTLNSCCTTPAPSSGANNLTAEPQLASASHLSAGSPCRGVGSASYATGVDIDGELWLSPPSIGCDEDRVGGCTGALAVAISAPWTNVAAGFALNLTASINGRVAASVWDFGDGTVVSNRPYASHAWSVPGNYAVVLRAYNEDHPGGVTTTVMIQVAAQPVFYVSAGSSTPLPPYGSWATAARNIQDAEDAATVPGALVLVTNGVYGLGGRVVYGAMTNRVAVTKAITVQSVNGPQVTVISGYQVPGTTNGDGAIRCVYLTSGAVLNGFTLTNGATRSSGDYGREQSGGGVWCQSGNALVTNCTLTGNSTYGTGGGASGGTLNNCTLTGNSAGSGGGAYGGTLNNCALSGNMVGSGGGASGGTLNNCTLTGNSATGSYYSGGGGAYYSTLNNCTFTGNSAPYGGGASYGMLNNCTLTGNSATGTSGGGGGVASGTLNNCILTGNSAQEGGGAYSGTLNNCTLTGNSAQDGGGAYSGALNNCILYYNTAVFAPNYDSSALNYCCTTPAPGSGANNLTAEPQLANFSHLSGASPCRGAGSAAYATGVDIDGELWLSPPSIGCDEYRAGGCTGALAVAISAPWTNVAAGFALDLTASISGRLSASVWDFGDGTVVSNRPYASHAWSVPGNYAVVLRAYNQDHPGGVSAAVMIQVVAPPVFYVMAGSSTPVPPYSSWGTAARNIQDAVDAAAVPGTLVLVTNGVYGSGGRVVYGAMTDRVAVTKAITVRSVNGPQVTVIPGYQVPGTTNGDGAIRCVYLADGAVLTGFTLTNGATRFSGDYDREQSGGGVWCQSGNALVANCTLTGNSAGSGGGGACGGTLNNCTLTGNSAGSGGGAYVGTLNNCALTGNSAQYDGGGAFSATLNNCVLTGNSAGSGGGGASGGTLNNCTLTGNSATSGGGAYHGTLSNCILYYNTALHDANCSGASLNYCCTTPQPSDGTNNITAEPQLASLSHLSSASPCRGAGSAAYATGVDIDGESWLSPPSIGCDEYRAGGCTGALAVAITAVWTNVVPGFALNLTASIGGRVSASVWDFGDGTVVSNRPYASHVWNAVGDYPVVLRAYNESHPGGVTATVTIRVVPTPVLYVSAGSLNPQSPYSSWATAAGSIQDAVDAVTIPGSAILVTNGVYDSGGRLALGTIINRVAVDRPVVLQSVNGPGVTVIQGYNDYDGAIRCVYLADGAILSGFTLANGAADSSPDIWENSGGGVWCQSLQAVVTNCTITGNSAGNGAGVYGGTLNNCTFTGNYADGQGGGACYGALNNCTLTGNSAYYGGGAYYGTLNNCTLTGNSANVTGVGFEGPLPVPYGGGAYGGTLNNCILYDNTGTIGPNYYESSDISLNYCCTTPLPTRGLGNIANPPAFQDAAHGNYRLSALSPCIDAGQNQAWMFTSTDPDGTPRIVNGTVDMGAYEAFLTLDLRVWLQGPYATNAHAMRAFNPTNLLLTSPYASDPRQVSTIPSNVVDWVLIELRGTNGNTAVAKSAFLNTQGQLLSTAGTTGITAEVSAGYYSVVVKHRNHLAVMSAQPVAFTNYLIAYDFTTGPSQYAGGSNGAVQLEPGVWGMVAGDADGDGEILAVDAIILIYSSLIGESGYSCADFNLDGTLSSADMTLWWANQGRSTGASNGETALLPALSIAPQRQTVLSGGTFTLTAAGTTNPVNWALAANPSGGTLVSLTATSAVYTAGFGSNCVDIVEAWDGNLLGRSWVNVISAADVTRVGKAIIIAGQRSTDDPVWPTTDYLGNLAYNTLLYRGFAKGNVQYLSPDINQDVDGNGALDDVALTSTFTNAERTFTNWAMSNPSQLFVYLVDHGGTSSDTGYFRLNPSEVLTPASLNQWLDAIQARYGIDVVVVLDFCESGSFLGPLQHTGPGKRTVITACSSNEPTYFVAGGQVSFSDAFFGGLLTGLDLAGSFNLARDAMSTYQSAELDANGDGVYTPATDLALVAGTYVGASFIAGKDIPQIGHVMGDQALYGATEATLWAYDIASAYELSRVWCLVVPPGHNPNPTNPVADLPLLEMAYNPGSGRYEAQYSGFSQMGTYKLVYYAQDIWESVSVPKQSYLFQNGFQERVVLVAGGDTNAATWPALDNMARLAYNTFRSRLLGPGAIYYLSPVAYEDVAHDGTNDIAASCSVSNLSYAITNWAAGANKLTVYLVGDGTNSTCRLNPSETLAPTDLKGWLDTYQASNGQAQVVMDFSGSGAFLPVLKAPPQSLVRICVASSQTNKPSLFGNGGIVSFGEFFLSDLFNGDSVGLAFAHARDSIKLASGALKQTALMDDNGDGVANKYDGAVAATSYIGAAFRTGGDPPVIGSVMSNGVVVVDQPLVLWAQDVTAVAGISNVWCVITPPDYDGSGDLPQVSLAWNAGTSRYEVVYANFTEPGTYACTFYAQDNDGVMSSPVQCEVMTPDAYEVDDNAALATIFAVGDTEEHNFHSATDEDWVKFYAPTGSVFNIEATQLGTNSDLVLDLYYEQWDGTLIWVDGVDDYGTGADQTESLVVDLKNPQSGLWPGVYYVRVSSADTNLFGPGSEYELRIYEPTGTGGGVITITFGGGVGVLAYIQVPITPQPAGAGWRLQGQTAYHTSPTDTETVAQGGSPVIEFKPVAGWDLPPGRAAQVTLGTTTVIPATYTRSAQLGVSPTGDMSFNGFVGGPFSLPNIICMLANSGEGALQWSAIWTNNWLSLSCTNGWLAGGAQTNITVSINTNANTLAGGSYLSTIGFLNQSNGLGNTTRRVSLTVAAHPPAAPVLTFNPASGLGITGTTGATFRLEYRTSLVSGQWLPLKTNTLGPGFNLLLPWPPTNGPAAFYRAVWLP